jgi:hypothetical protein
MMDTIADFWTRLEQATALYKARELTKALPVYLEVIASAPAEAEQHLPNIYGKALFCSARLQDWPKTETLAREVVSRYPTFSPGHRYLGEALLAKGESSSAVEALQKAVELSPAQREAMELLRLARKGQAPVAHKKPKIWPTRQSDFDDPAALIRKFLVRGRDTEKFITPDTTFMTLGSCFAQNLGTRLKSAGYKTYFEPIGEEVNSTFANRFLLQWVESGPTDDTTTAMQETYGDATRSRLLESIKNSDVIVLTLGVAPCFFHAETGEFFPILSVRSSSVTKHLLNTHVMRTTTVAENVKNVSIVFDTIARLSHKDPRIVLTVSPVPLAATTEFDSAIVADCLSKSTLRVACEEAIAAQTNMKVIYWPSFEIVRWLGAHYSKSVPSAYAADDGLSRHVSQWLVNLIIDQFLTCYAEQPLGLDAASSA